MLAARTRKTAKVTAKRPAAAVQHAIFTIGYQERTALDFVRALRAADVAVLVDIRAVPLSRRAEFRKNALATLLDDAGIRYVGLSGLGTPKDLRDRLKADGDYASFFVDFRRHMMTRRADLKTLADIAKDSNAALLCFEREATKCHRSVVARYISNKLSCLTVDL